MGTTTYAGIAAVVLLIFITIWMKVIRPKRIKAANDAATEVENARRKAETARCREMMERIIPLMSEVPASVEVISQAVGEVSGETVRPELVAAALAWETTRQVHCRIECVAKKGFKRRQKN